MNYFTAVRRSTSVGRSGRKRERQRNLASDRSQRTTNVHNADDLSSSKSPRPRERGWSAGESSGSSRPGTVPHVVVSHGHKQLLYRSCSSDGRIGSASQQARL